MISSGTVDSENAAAMQLTPLFIFGVARSGTTYTSYLLNQHPTIRCAREAVVFQEGFSHYARSRNLRDPVQFRQLLERLASCDAGSRANQWLSEALLEHGEALYQYHQQHPSFGAIISKAFELSQPGLTCFANKFIRTEFCSLLLREWPEARIVLLVRDPRAAYASQRRYFGMRLKYAAIYWNLHAQYALRLQDVDPRYLVLRFEDLMQSPVEHLERLLQFANQNQPGLAEQIIAQIPPRRASLDKWRDDLSTGEVRRIEAYCYESMQSFGYVPEQAHGACKITTLGRLSETVLQYANQVPLDLATWRNKRIISRFWQVARGFR